MRRGVVNNEFDSVTNAAGCLGDLRPNRLKDRHDARCVDVRDRPVAYNREHVVLERMRPLSARMVAAPAWFVRSNIGHGTLPERHCAQVISLLLTLRSALGAQRVDTVQALPLGVNGALPRFRQAEIVAAPQSHVVLLVANAISEQPTSCAPGSNLEVGAMANGIAPGLGDSRQVLGGRIAPHVHLPVYAQEITRTCG